MSDKKAGQSFKKVLDTVFPSIFKFLDTREACVSQRMCKHWRKLSSSKPEAWRVLDFSYCSPHAVTDNVIAQQVRLHPAVVSVNLKFCSKITAAALQSVASLKDLTELNIEGCGKMLEDRTLSLLRPCVNLRKLVLDGCAKVTAIGLKPLVQSCRQLQELSLNGVTAVNDQLLAIFADVNISSLHLNSASSITDIGLLSLASKLGPKLTELHLAYCASLTDKGIEDLAKHCPNLTNVNLYGIFNLSDRSLVALKHCTNLQVLDLSMCRKISDQGMGALLKGGSKLSSINLYDCNSLSAQTLNALADLCPNLRYLGAYGLDELTKGSARAFLLKARRLQRVDFGGCAKLSGADIETLSKEFPRVTF